MVDRNELKNILHLLRKHFPKVFPEKGFVVFKKKIDFDICQVSGLDITRTKLRAFFQIYTGHPGYFKAHIKGAKRYNLEGEVVGEVTEEEYEQRCKHEERRIKRKKYLQRIKQREQQEQKQSNTSATTTVERDDKLKELKLYAGSGV